MMQASQIAQKEGMNPDKNETNDTSAEPVPFVTEDTSAEPVPFVTEDTSAEPVPFVTEKQREKVRQPMSGYDVFARARTWKITREHPEMPNNEIVEMLDTEWKQLHWLEKKPFFEEAERLRQENAQLRPKESMVGNCPYNPVAYQAYYPSTATILYNPVANQANYPRTATIPYNPVANQANYPRTATIPYVRERQQGANPDINETNDPSIDDRQMFNFYTSYDFP